MDEFGVVLKAVEFSARKHRDQRRKSAEGVPYINHPIEVCRVLWEHGEVRDPHILAAGLLHDTIEDTDTTAEELEREFGSAITAIVLEVTDDGELPKLERKRLQIESACHKSNAACLVKLADKYCNVRDIATAPPAHWDLERRREYVKWARSVVGGLTHQPARLRKLFEDSCDKTESELSTLS